MTSLRIGLIQMHVSADKVANLRRAAEFVARCASDGAGLVVLPEMFCCPYDTACFPLYAEPAGGQVWTALSEMARASRVTLVGGSMPELDSAGRIYNTSFIFDPSGRQLGCHRKMHLFDIAVQGGQHFRESDALSPGSSVTIVDTEFGKLGVMVCYDLRFPELARLMALQGASILVVPGAFNMTTGPAHWEVLHRARAVDNQVWMLGCSPARDETAGYVAYGHSIIVSPWGEVLARLAHEEAVLLADLDLAAIDRVRAQLPVLSQRRTDLYDLSQKSSQPETN